MDLTAFTEENTDYPISKVAQNEWLDFAMYTVESRAIPNMIDGLKPVQRFYLYSSLVNTKKDFKKVSAVSGVISDYGYNHGEASAAGAGQLMAAEWNNNVCLVEGRGSFGTRLVQEAGAARYVYTRLSPNFHRYITDTDLSPLHEDPEHEPPAFYVPIIPLVLVNGQRGIATGFATLILPRNPIDVAKACKEYIEKGKAPKELPISFPQFKGSVEPDTGGSKFTVYGTYRKKTKTTLSITEVPYGYDRESYVKILDQLEDDGDIVSYEDRCDKNGFRFEVKLKQNTSAKWNTKQIYSKFKLTKSFTENITVIGPDGKLKEYDTVGKLIEDFCDWRLDFLQKRIDQKIEEHTAAVRWLGIRLAFIEAVRSGDIDIMNLTKTDLTKVIVKQTGCTTQETIKLISMPISSIMKSEPATFKRFITEEKKKLKFWKTTTTRNQFLNDLSELNENEV